MAVRCSRIRNAVTGALLVAAFCQVLAGDLTVGVFGDRRSIAKEVVAQALKEKGVETRLFSARDVSAGKVHDCGVLFFGGGWGSYDWVDVNGRTQLVEFVQKRGGGVIFSMFRCGAAARGLIRPIFPEVAYAYNKANGPGLVVTDKAHPIVEGLPAEFMTPYWDHAVLRLGSEGRMVASDRNGDVSIACGEVGLGRVVFLGPWIGLNRDGKPVHPLPAVDEKMLMNSIRWASGSPHRVKDESTKVSEEIKLKVLRHEKILDWTHEGRGVSWFVGILTKAMYLREATLDDLSFRTARLLEYAKDAAEAKELLQLHERCVQLRDELRANYEQAKRDKIAEISRMPVAELEKDPVRSLSSYRRMKREQKQLEEERIEEWQNRLVFPHQIEPVQKAVTRLEAWLARTVAEANEEMTAREKAENLAATPRLIEQSRRILVSTPRTEWEARQHARIAKAVLELGRIGRVPDHLHTTDALLKALRDHDYQVRRNAIYALGWMQAADAVRPLVAAARERTDKWTKRRVVQALGQIGDARATGFLIEALKNEDRFVRQNAILALGWLGAREAVAPLCEILRSPGIETQFNAPALPKSNEWTREDAMCAMRALGHIGDEAALPVIQTFREEHGEKVTRARRFTPCLGVNEAAELAIKEIEAGGRKEKGIKQPNFLKQKEHFYWLPGRYNALYGRYWSYGNYPQDVNVMAGYAASSGGTGLIQWKSCDAIEERIPGGDQYMRYFSELGLKQNPCFRWRGNAIFDKAGFEKDILRWGKYPALGGFWAEEALFWDAALRSDERFREYLVKKYRPRGLAAFGIADPATVKCPEPEEGRGSRRVYAWKGGRAQKFIFAEYMEYLADTGVEIWQEAQEWLMGLRKGTYLTFNLSQRYTKGGSTYINAYPRISQVLGANGPQSYGAHSYVNNFHLDMVCDGEPRPALAEFYAHQADTPGRVERGFASSFLHGQCFFVWWWGHVFKHSPDTNGGAVCWDKGRWEAAVRQFGKGRAISEYLAPQETESAKVVAQLYSGRTTTLTYGRGRVDGFGGVTSGGRMYRYTQNQQAIWESLLQSHLPVDMTWLETMSRVKLNRYRVAVLSDAYSLAKEEVLWLQSFVKGGGVLIATGGSSRHDQWDRPLSNYALAELFGVDYVKTEMAGPPDDAYLYVERDLKPETGIDEIRIADPMYVKHLEGQEAAEYDRAIGYDVVKVTTGKIIGTWADGRPAVVENRCGKGYCILLTPIYPGLSHQTGGWTVNELYKDFWPGSRELMAGCVRRALELVNTALPLSVSNCPKRVEVALKIQPARNRSMIHFLNMDPKMALVKGIGVSLLPPEGKSVSGLSYVYPAKQSVEYRLEEGRLVFDLRDFDVHEMVVAEWK